MPVVLQFGSTSLRLPSPDFDNDEKLEFDRISRKSRGGDLIIFRDSSWTQTTTLDWKFSYMTYGKVQALLQFLKDSLGQFITITDYEGFLWTGVILTPGGDVSQPSRDDGCSGNDVLGGGKAYSAGFQFQGQRIG